MSLVQQGRLRIAFGALAEPLKKQVQNCGLRLDPGEVDMLQGCADSLVKLRIHHVITDGESHKACLRLMKKILAATSFPREEHPNG